MTGTEIRETLRAVGHAVDVPTVDQAAFDDRVRRHRRHRTLARVGAAAALVALVGGTGIAGAAWGPWERDAAPAPATDPSDTAVDPEPPAWLQKMQWAPTQVPVVVDGVLAITSAEHPDQLLRTDVPVRRLLRSKGPVVTDLEGRWRGVVLLSDGKVHNTYPLVRREVDAVWVSAWRTAYVPAGSDRVVIEGDPFTKRPLALPGGVIPSVATVGWLDGAMGLASGEGTSLRLTTPYGSRVVETGAVATAISVRGPTIAYATADGTQLRGPDGALRALAPGSVGALAPSGLRYAAATGDGLVLVDAFSGAQEAVALDATGPVVGVWWHDDDTFYVVSGDGTRTLSACEPATATCTERLTDDTGTLELPES